MIIGIVTAVVLSFQYVRTLLSEPVTRSLWQQLRSLYSHSTGPLAAHALRCNRSCRLHSGESEQNRRITRSAVGATLQHVHGCCGRSFIMWVFTVQRLSVNLTVGKWKIRRQGPIAGGLPVMFGVGGVMVWAYFTGWIPLDGENTNYQQLLPPILEKSGVDTQEAQTLQFSQRDLKLLFI